MSALPPKADICIAQAHVRFGPIADITLSELGAIFAGNFVQLLLASLYWRGAGSRSYFAEKTFQPDRCNGPEQNQFMRGIFPWDLSVQGSGVCYRKLYGQLVSNVPFPAP